MARRRKRHDGNHPPEMDERWAVSYLDMMTVLFLTFVVLFSMSSIDAGKYDQLKNALATGFGQKLTDLDDRQAGQPIMEPGKDAVDPAHPVPPEDTATQPPEPPAQEPRTAREKLEAIRAGVQSNLKAMNREADVEFAQVNGALVIRILSGETLFSPDTAALSDSARELLAGITPVIEAEEGTVSVEGHADYLEPRNYETNWELSADRAVQVVRHMVDAQGLPAASVSATGFGDTRPLDGERDNLDRNRRVDIVVNARDDPATTQKTPDDAAEAEARRSSPQATTPRT
ncbi:flagellar motor protein MotB [Citricoccus sp. GCM10030269]|uniref:flagellar motor protein MotB n=1 Tax=Citricoccus sp. GCM10030269 TaxID=3273388 RepID=UPI003608A9B1